MLAVTQNPYRVLGLYSNTPSSEVSPSVERLRGMLANGVPATLPLGELLSSPVERTEASLTEAEQALSNPDGRLDAALFWFVDIEQRDAQAFTHLRSGHSDEAGKCWQVADDADNSWAATHNRIVLALSEEDWATFAALAPDYYAGPATSLLQVVDGAPRRTTQQLTERFLELLCQGSYKACLTLQQATFPTEWRITAQRQLDLRLSKGDEAAPHRKEPLKKSQTVPLQPQSAAAPKPAAAPATSGGGFPWRKVAAVVGIVALLAVVVTLLLTRGSKSESHAEPTTVASPAPAATVAQPQYSLPQETASPEQRAAIEAEVNRVVEEVRQRSAAETQRLRRETAQEEAELQALQAERIRIEREWRKKQGLPVDDEEDNPDNAEEE